jgi:drug/metabolite transporter (DMT)-like permease
MKRSIVVGVLAAVIATFAWSLNFVVPFVIGDYTIFDFALFQFLLPATLSLGFLAFNATLVRNLQRRDWLVAFALGLIGYLAYSLALVGAALYAGPVIAPAFLGSVPIVLAVIGNLRDHSVPWKVLAVPLLLALAGLLMVNGSGFDSTHTGELPFLRQGILLAIVAVACWVTFGLANQAALRNRPGMDAGVWTALILCGAGIGMLAFFPFGVRLGVFNVAQLGLTWGTSSQFIVWVVCLGVLVNIGGALAWTIASQRLPVALAAQLITLEPTFGTLFGLSMQRRWPTVAEVTGMVALLAGVLIAVRATANQSVKAKRPSAANVPTGLR